MANCEGKYSAPIQHNGNWCQSRLHYAGALGDRQSNLRRVVSMRALNTHLDSSESIPSEHSSLYDAILTSFESEHNDRQQGPAINEQVGVSETDPFVDSIAGSRANTLDGQQRRNTWAVPPLETIVEQESISTTQDPSAKSLLRPRTSGGVSLVTKSSYSRMSAPRPLLERKQYGTKVYPFDDLDIPSNRPKFSFSSLPGDRYHHKIQSSSSDDGFKTPEWINESTSLVGPTQPIYPPPIRPPTPPGFPSFGSPEALQYNSSAQARRNRQAAQNNTQSLQQNKSARNTILVGTSGSDFFSCCGFRLRRLFAIAPRPAPQTPVLPPGVVARAEDGTLIRGRFGVRQSGHGVGSNPASAGLSNHPFHRRALPVARVKDNEFCDSHADYATNTSHLNNNRSALRQSSHSSLTPTPESHATTPPARIRTLGNSRSSVASATSIPVPASVTHQQNLNQGRATAQPTASDNPQMHYSGTECPIPGTDGSAGETLPISISCQENLQTQNSPLLSKGHSFGFLNLIQDLFLKCCGLGRSSEDSENDIPLRQYRHHTSTDGNGEGPVFHGRRSTTPWRPTWDWNPCFGCQHNHRDVI